MNITSITKGISTTFHKVSLQTQKHSPELLIVAGIAGTITAAILACRATTKVGQVMDEAKEKLDMVKQAAEAGELANGEDYTEQDRNKDLAIVYLQTGLQLTKLYGPAIALGALSITGIVSSNVILRKRNVALAAAYATVDKGFKEYRNRVVDRFGKEVDQELRHNVKAIKIEKTIVDDNGKEKKVKETINVTERSEYAKFFDATSKYWEKDPAYNLLFLRSEQNYANDKLRSQGYLFLNDVYDRLDLPKTKAGQVVGWLYRSGLENEGDNYVDFGIYEAFTQGQMNFVNGYEPVVLLDFNVDGPILDLMGKEF